jgi:hypothetical protein
MAEPPARRLLSLVIPALNEAANLLPALDTAGRGLRLVASEAPRITDIIRAAAEAEERRDPSTPVSDNPTAEVPDEADAASERAPRPIGRLLPNS